MNKKITSILDKMIRVNLAGETGAKNIYSNQIKHSTDLIENLESSLSQELRHLEYFQNMAKKYQIRPTIMSPVWKHGAKLLGFVTSKIGKQAVDGCTSGVEEVISKHYANQINDLYKLIENTVDESQKKDLIKLQSKISEFMSDELEHFESSMASNTKNSIKFNVTKSISSFVTSFAVKISERI